MSKLILTLTALALGVSSPTYAKDAPTKTIDVNAASKKELMTLDGIGDARADAIIKGRCYTGKDEIKAKAEVPDAVYDKIKEKIVAKQDTCKAKPAKKETPKSSRASCLSKPTRLGFSLAAPNVRAKYRNLHGRAID